MRSSLRACFAQQMKLRRHEAQFCFGRRTSRGLRGANGAAARGGGGGHKRDIHHALAQSPPRRRGQRRCVSPYPGGSRGRAAKRRARGGGEAHGGEAAAHGPGAVQSADAGHGGHEAAGRGACSAGAGRSDGNGVAPAAAVVAGGWRTSGSEFLGCQVGGEAIVRMRVCVYACATCAGAAHATAMFEASSATARYAAALSCCDVCRRSATAEPVPYRIAHMAIVYAAACSG